MGFYLNKKPILKTDYLNFIKKGTYTQKNMGKVGGCELIGLLLCLAGVTLAAVAVATPYWTSTTNYYQGLWKTCTVTSGVASCTNIDLNFGNDMIMTISRIAFFVGFAFCAIAFLVGACGLCKKDSRQGSVAAQG